MANRTIGTAEGRYRTLERLRDPYLQRGRECSKYSIPSLLPEEGHSSVTKVKTPFQGVGAEGTNNLAAKLLIVQLPPNQSFFRLQIDEMVLEEAGSDEERGAVEKALSKFERIIKSDIEQSADRVVVFEALKHLIVVGNVLLYDDKDGLQVFHLDRYVVKRDPMGNPIEIVVHETVAPDSLPADFYKKVKSQAKERMKERGSEKTLDLFTHIERHPDKWTVYQECMGRKIPGTYGTYPVDACPWLPLRMLRIAGEDYGRSYVEELLGDLKSLEALTQAIVEGSAAAAKILILVDSNGTTSVKTIADAPNGAVREGNAKDITVLQLEKYADFRVALETARMIEERLSRAFLLMQGVQRDAERVTAEEVRIIANELETRLGGIYSILTVEFQLPFVKRKMLKLQKQGRLPQLPKGVVEPTIVTGLDALGRDYDRSKLVRYLSTLGEILGPEVLQVYVEVREAADRLAASDGIDTDGLIKSQEQIDAAQQQGQMQALVSQFGPKLMEMMGKQAQGGLPNGEGQE